MEFKERGNRKVTTGHVNGQLLEYKGCLNGSSLETKFPDAHTSCNIDGNDHWEFDIVHQNAADSCNFESLKRAFTEQSTDGVCLMSALGWINKDHSLNNNAVKMDLATLPEKVVNGISQLQIRMCIRAHHQEMDNLLGEGCDFSADEKATLTAINEKIADYKCLLQAFGRSCFMNSGMYEYESPLENMNNNGLNPDDSMPEEFLEEDLDLHEFDPELEEEDDFSPEDMEDFEEAEFNPEDIDEEDFEPEELDGEDFGGEEFNPEDVNNGEMDEFWNQ